MNCLPVTLCDIHTLQRCYENGVDQQVVQKLLGHSTLAMTTDLYTHVSEEKKKEEVAELKILALNLE